MSMRERPTEPHYCQCVLVFPGGSEEHCSGLVGPDEPFCLSCQGRHPEYPSLVEVTVRQLRGMQP